MPRRKQSNPQPVKLDSEDGLGVDNPGSLVLESDFLLGQDLEFGDSDDKIIGFERDSEDSVAAEIVIPVYALSDDDCSSYNRLSMESDAEDPRDTESEREESHDHTLQHYLSCRQCGQLLDSSLGGLDLATPYCLKCGDSGEGGGGEEDETTSVSAPDSKENGGSNGSVRKVYSCKLCSFSSRYSNHLKRHMKTHNGEKPFKCPHCTYASAQLVNLQRHVRTHTDAVVSDLTLHVSNSTDFLQSYTSLKPEMDPRSLLDTDGVAEESDTLPELLFPFTCRLCGLVLDDGFMHEDGSSSQICSKCGLEMLSKEAPSSPEKSDKVYSCALCPFITHYPNHLARHMKTHSGEKPYKCPQCDYASAHFDNLKRHQRVHTGEKPYKCHLCDYACGNLANLKRHERIHSGAKPFKCSVCNYSCNQSMNLKRHMLRHTGEKPFKCQECPYTTGHWDNYKRHQKKHGHSTEGWTKVQQPGSAVS
ncbi:zinc finger protein 513 isoform X2 [Lepisosteus oculatus]|uniref:zinc finger protein 513 isoform X2 n=1 Tax=Lepisosteus oculatus TaxID=7918 RepID=UPI00073FE082|nr:PREDICTED: zinc finger protein 513 isoform X3 [Lepisosteus oculatus]